MLMAMIGIAGAEIQLGGNAGSEGVEITTASKEPLWQGNQTNMLTSCIANNYAYGLDGSGNWLCREDQIGNGTSSEILNGTYLLVDGSNNMVGDLMMSHPNKIQFSNVNEYIYSNIGGALLANIRTTFRVNGDADGDNAPESKMFIVSTNNSGSTDELFYVHKSGNTHSTANISASYFLGDGSLLTNIPDLDTNLSNGGDVAGSINLTGNLKANTYYTPYGSNVSFYNPTTGVSKWCITANDSEMSFGEC